MSYVSPQEVANPVQITKYVELLRFQHILKLCHFCWKFIHFKAVYWWFLQIQICEKMRVLIIFKIIDYAVWFVLKFMNKI